MSAGEPSRCTWIQPLRSAERLAFFSRGSATGSREISVKASPIRSTAARRTDVRRIPAIIVKGYGRHHSASEADRTCESGGLSVQTQSKGVGQGLGRRAPLAGRERAGRV